MAIEDIIANAEARADSALADAQNALDSATDAIRDITAITVLPGPIGLPDIENFVPAVAPNLTAVVVDTTGAPGSEPVLESIPDPLTGVTEPVLSAVAPDYTEPTQPSAPGEAPAAPEITTDFDEPAAPDLDVGSIPVPNIIDKVAPSAPELLIPEFEELAPVNNAVAPSALDQSFLSNYRALAPDFVATLEAQFDGALAKLGPQFSELEDRLTELADGNGTYREAIEAAIFERARDKINAEFVRARDGVYDEAAQRGYTLPPGAVATSMRAIRSAAADAAARAASETAIKQAELQQENIRFALDQIQRLKSTVITASISYHQSLVTLNAQAITAAQSIVNALVESYNVAVRAYSSKVESFRAQVSAYEASLRGVTAKVEIYRSEIAAFEAGITADRSKVDVYRSRIDALNSAATLYRSQIDAVVSLAQLERTKVDAYQAQVQGYAAKVQAYNAQWQGYAAAVNGQLAKVQVYSERIKAYNAEVDAYKTKVDAKKLQVEAAVSKNELQVRKYATQWQGYAAKMQAEGTKAQAIADQNRVLLGDYTVANQAAVAAQQASAERARAIAQVAIERSKLDVGTLLQSAQLQLDKAKAVASGVATIGQSYASLAGSALSGINSLAAKYD